MADPLLFPDAAPPFKLRAYATFRTADGRHYHVVGPVRIQSEDGPRCFWTLEGDHFDENGNPLPSLYATARDSDRLVEQVTPDPYNYKAAREYVENQRKELRTP